MPIISGVVRDKSGAPTARTLRFYRRDTGALLGSTTSAQSPLIPGDPEFSNVVSFLAVSAQGALVDMTGAAVTVVGQPVITSSGTYAPHSVLLGSGVYLHRALSGFAAGADFTVEGFVSNDGSTLSYTAITSLLTASGMRSTFMLNGSDGRPVWDGTWRLPTSTLTGSTTTTPKHIAMCRSAGAYKVFVNGTLAGSASWTGSPIDTNAPTKLAVGAATERVCRILCKRTIPRRLTSARP